MLHIWPMWWLFVGSERKAPSEVPVFLIRLMSRSIEPMLFANSIRALAIISICWSVVLFGLSAALAKDPAEDVLN